MNSHCHWRHCDRRMQEHECKSVLLFDCCNVISLHTLTVAISSLSTLRLLQFYPSLYSGCCSIILSHTLTLAVYDQHYAVNVQTDVRQKKSGWEYNSVNLYSSNSAWNHFFFLTVDHKFYSKHLIFLY